MIDNGQGMFSGSGVCAPTPTQGNYQCLCEKTTECSILGGDECVPIVNTIMSVLSITGPYVCTANDGSGHDGCRVGGLLGCQPLLRRGSDGKPVL